MLINSRSLLVLSVKEALLTLVPSARRQPAILDGTRQGGIAVPYAVGRLARSTGGWLGRSLVGGVGVVAWKKRREEEDEGRLEKTTRRMVLL